MSEVVLSDEGFADYVCVCDARRGIFKEMGEVNGFVRGYLENGGSGHRKGAHRRDESIRNWWEV